MPDGSHRDPLATWAVCATGLGGFALACPAAGEVGGVGDAAVEVGPALAVGQRLLDAVEAAQVAAEVVDHVHERGLARAGHDRAAVLELAVVGEDDVEHGLGRRRRGKPSMSSIVAPDAVVAERDLAEQLAGVGELDRAVDARVGLDLADVVQQRAGDGDVAVDPRERSRPSR